jgi:hypothetical protein
MKLKLLSAEAAAGPAAALHQQQNTQCHPPSKKNNSVNIPFNSLHTHGEGKQMFPLCRISAGDMADQDTNL